MPFAAVYMFSVFVFYTTAIRSEKIKKSLRPWMIVMFFVGFICDLIGTTMMYFMATTHELNWHSFCGYSALGGMLLHLIWAFLAIFNLWKFEKLFHKWSVVTWGIWMFAFFTGIPK